MSSVNSLIADAVKQANAMTLERAAELSMACTYMAAASSIALVMSNAMVAEQASQQVAQAATATTSAMIIAAGAA